MGNNLYIIINVFVNGICILYVDTCSVWSGNVCDIKYILDYFKTNNSNKIGDKKMKEDKIRFKDLSGPCKVGIVGGYIYAVIVGVMFVIGFILGIFGAL